MTLQVNWCQHKAIGAAFELFMLVLHALCFFHVARQEVSACSFCLFFRRHFVTSKCYDLSNLSIYLKFGNNYYETKGYSCTYIVLAYKVRSQSV